MRAYKVCMTQFDRHWSARTPIELIDFHNNITLANLAIDRTILRYRIGVPTMPVVGAIFAFMDLKDARKFLSHHGRWRTHAIYRGIGDKYEGKQVAFINCCAGYEKMQRAWDNGYWVGRRALPDGTVLLQSFTPTKLIWEGIYGNDKTIRANDR